jgi:hypothetical protein
LVIIFNQEIKVNILPSSLTHLTFGISFNQKIKVNILPSSLTHLTMGCDFNRINNISKTIIELGFCNYCLIKNNMPEFIETIVIYLFDYSHSEITNLPTTIKIKKT